MLARVLLLAICGLLLSGNLAFAAEDEKAALQAAIEKAAADYQKAFNARDAESIVKLFAPEAEYVDSSGLVFHGRDAIQAEFLASFEMNPPGEVDIDILSIRPVAKGVVIEEGISTFRDKEEQTSLQGRYTATHVQQPDGTWLMVSVRELEDPQITPHDRLKVLSWLEGAWREDVGGGIAKTEWKWSEDGNFLISEFQLLDRNELLLKGTQRIGWDAERQQFRSWVFDSTGGSAEGWWTAEPDGTWSVQLNGVDASGARITGVLTYFHDGADGLVITRDRQTRSGMSMPTFVHRVVRQPPAPGESSEPSQKASR
ncbi:YybH family protein [Planctomicrobium sp. SH527]|uniref:YybH family protein n=1 Tax=Planctomicrobium sp. SH527 TaxID=3448123 RepID=UPI003F5BE8EB